MNGTRPYIRIIQPFSDAVELVKVVLFRPFDLTKWLAIGFAAFLSNLAGGRGFNFNFPTNLGGSERQHVGSMPEVFHELGPWLIPILVGLGLLFFAIVVVFLWLGCRGHFIFTDCIVRNRGAIVEPWKEFRREGNSLFLFTLAVILVFLVFIALLVAPVVILWVSTERDGFSTPGLIAAICAGAIYVAVIIYWWMVMQFLTPTMYRQRVRAAVAFRQGMALVGKFPGEMVLYLLFSFVIGIAVVIALVFVTCATCCIAMIPYIGTVIMLPIFVCLQGYRLLFVRQFGAEYDVWGVLPPAPPPVQTIAPVEPPPPPASEAPPAPETSESSPPESFAPPEERKEPPSGPDEPRNE